MASEGSVSTAGRRGSRPFAFTIGAAIALLGVGVVAAPSGCFLNSEGLAAGGAGGTGSSTSSASSSSSSSGMTGCTSASQCDDNEECTTDDCVQGECTHAPVSGCLDCSPSEPCAEMECNTVACENNKCVYTALPAGSALPDPTANDCKKRQCNDQGAAESVADPMDLPADDGNACTTEGCNGDMPTTTNIPAGMPCDNGNGICSAENPPECFSCTNGTKDGDESDTDCGGSCPNKCTVGQVCVGDGDCTINSCESGLCQLLTCTNLIPDGTESDVDCGGASCPGCDPGDTCALGSDCKSGACVGPFAGSGNVCCDAACAGPCKACDLPGSTGACSNLPEGFNGSPNTPLCPSNQLCSGGACMATIKKAIGGTCTLSSECASNTCAGGYCKLPNGAWCDGDLWCASGRCNQNSCAACAGNGDCATNACNNGVCKLPDHAPCAVGSDCAIGSCTFGFCRKGIGVGCASGSECVTGYCTNGVCTTCSSGPGHCGGLTCAGGFCLFPAGDPCSSGSSCNSGMCTAPAPEPFKTCQ